MFQLDRGDLDFGLYRIMNMKAKEVDAFLDKDLLPQVQAVLGSSATERHAAMEEQVEQARATAMKSQDDPEKSPQVIELKKRLAAARADATAEADVYNHLVNFFSRYYNEGDFVSQRRYSGNGESAYLIPYDGEEVKLHWANADQYYIKTTENYASYIFTADAATRRRVRFEIAAANNEKDNIKPANGKQRRFVPARGGDAVAIEGDDLVVRFEHRPLTESEGKRWPGNGNGGRQQGKINAGTVKKIMGSKALDPEWNSLLAAPEPTEANGERTLLEKHIERYTAKNAFDYFIHKDLKKFLRCELDLYLNTEVLNLDELGHGDVFAADQALARVRATRHIGRKVIDFLAQLEDFQKQLWLKKKFVLESHWCVTLDRAPEALYPEIAANEKQRQEWVELLSIDEIKGDLGNGNAGYAAPLSVEFLRANPFLVLDTRHFDRDFTERLLEALSDSGPLDEQMDGLLIHGENFQALNLLQARYRGQVECAHIDPPYNTATSGFLYKNNYRHSSWLSMMENRIANGAALLANDGSLLCHIDENEYERLHYLFECLGIPDAGTVVWDKRNPMTGGRGVATQHEYVAWRSATQEAVYFRNKNIQSMLDKVKELSERHGGITEAVRKEYAHWIGDNSDLSGGEKACRYIDDEGRIYRDVSLRAPEPRTDPKFFQPLMHPVTGKPCVVPPNGFSRTPETLQAMMERGEIIFGSDETTQPRQKRCLTSESKRPVSSVIQDARRGKANLDALGLENFPYCHPVSLYMELIGAAAGEPGDVVLDYFAGSGTTGHAVINLNREDGGNRKYILTEMADHFDSVLLPRIKKVVHSADWKEGKPVSRDGCSQAFKYLRLESYEDTLDALELAPPQDDLLAQDAKANAELLEDYRLRYALGEETANSACLLGKRLLDPFAYTLSVVRDGVRREVHVDLPETFNYLIGLRPASRRRIDGVLVIAGADAAGRSCLVLWRNQGETDQAALDKWFTDNRQKFPDSLDVVYVNGDHTLEAFKPKKESWVVETIDPVFRKLMFEATSDA